MDSKFQSSFIPKSPILGSNKEEKEKIGLLGVLATLIFTASVLSIGGTFVYKKIVQSSIDSIKSQLATAEAGVDKASINNLLDFDKRMRSIQKIVNGHVAVSGYLDMLEKNTVSGLHFNTLNYNTATAGSNVEVLMAGKAPSYAAVALQESTLLQNPNTISVSFGNLSLDKTTGGVLFNLKAVFKDSLVSFSDLIKPTQ